MDALEQLSHYRHVEPVDDSVVDAAVEAVTVAACGDPVSTGGPTRRAGRRRRLTLAVGAALAAMAAGGGIAAAAGVFQGPPPLLPSVQALLSSPNPAEVPGATVQQSIAGPDGTTLQVVTDTAIADNQVDSCAILTINGPNGQPEYIDGRFECSGLVTPAAGTVDMSQPATTPTISRTVWQAPTGSSYDIIYGQGVPGLTTVTLTNSGGVPAATEPADPGGYVIYLPTASLTSYSHLNFNSGPGKVLYSQNINS